MKNLETEKEEKSEVIHEFNDQEMIQALLSLIYLA